MIKATTALRKIAGIYKITNPKGLVYIGQSVDVYRRKNEYKLLRCKRQHLIYRSLKKYGFDNHKFEVLAECDVKDLNNFERYYQDLYDVLNTGLNLSLVYTDSQKYVHSDLAKQKISKGKRAYKFTDEHKESIRQTRLGTKLKQSTKDKLSKISKRITSNAMLSKPLPYSNIVLDINTGVFYYSERDLSRYHSLGKTAISKRLKNNTLEGYILV